MAFSSAMAMPVTAQRPDIGKNYRQLSEDRRKSLNRLLTDRKPRNKDEEIMLVSTRNMFTCELKATG